MGRACLLMDDMTASFRCTWTSRAMRSPTHLLFLRWLLEQEKLERPISDEPLSDEP